jgi:hypothetical protein
MQRTLVSLQVRIGLPKQLDKVAAIVRRRVDVAELAKQDAIAGGDIGETA